MKFENLFKIAFRSLSKNKMRTFLTMLGIIIGVGSVITMLAIGEGSRKSIQEQISKLGTNVIIIFASAMRHGGVASAAGTTQLLTQADADAIATQCPEVQYVTPVVNTGGQIIYGNQNWQSSVTGVYPNFFAIRNQSVVDGYYFTEADEREAAKVCVVGQTVVDHLFTDGTNPVGAYIRINKIPFKILGVLEKQGQNSWGRDQDDVIIAPFSTVYKRMVSVDYVRQILASSKSSSDMAPAISEISAVLNQRHKTVPGSDPIFTVRTQLQFEQTANETSRVLTLLLASIAGISLLVGGIGIMNIMLVSVTERTREIGIRLAIGARGRDVLLQFLIEAVILSLLGGLIGVGTGMLATHLVESGMHWPVSITPDSVTLSFLFAAIVGIFFGWYPARKAAELNPIDALRYE